MARIQLSGTQIPTLSKLNIDGELTLDAASGTTGQVLTSAGSGVTPTWTTPISNTTQTAKYFYAAPNFSDGTPVFRAIVGSDLSQYTSPSVGGSVLQWTTGLNATTWSSTAALLTGGGTMTGDLVLAAGSATVEPIKFQNNSATPTVTSGAMDYDGTVFYAVSKTNPGRALLAQNYYYLSSADVSIDMSSASLPLSLLTTTTTGITVPAGTTYDYEAIFAIRGTFIATSQTPTITISNLSGTATMAHATIIETGNNTTGFTTASTLGTTRITAGQALTALTAGSRYYIVKMRGVIRVTGSGTAEIAPTIRPNVGSADNGWLVQSGAMFKLTPIGDGTVTTVGTWA